MSLSGKPNPPLKVHKASGNAYVVLSGKRVYLGRADAPDVGERYDRTVAEWRADGCATPLDRSAPLHVVELIERYAAYINDYYRTPTGEPSDTLQRFKRPLRDLRLKYGNVPVSQFKPLSLLALRETWIDAGLAVATINDCTSAIRHMFKWGVSRELVTVETHIALAAVENLKKGRSRAKPGKKVAPVPEKDVLAVLPFLPTPLQALVQIQLHTGARSGELLQLRPRDIDRSDSEVWSATLEHHKTEDHGIVRVLHFGPKCQEILRPLLLRDSNRPLFSPQDAERERYQRQGEGKVGRRPNQKPNPRKTARTVREAYDRQGYNRAIHRACEKAGVPRWHPHQLRHTRATELRRIMGLEAARIALGHSSSDTTLIYAEIDRGKAKEIAREHG